jgi:hypothetical protein
LFDIPIALGKAVVMFRKLFAEEPASMSVSYDGKDDSISRKLVDSQALIVISSVCRYWRRIISSCNPRSLQQLRRSFNSKLIRLYSLVKIGGKKCFSVS